MTEPNMAIQRVTGPGELDDVPLEVRAAREELLRQNPDQWDERTAVEKLVDRIISARMAHYRPGLAPNLRRDIVCFCCGNPYRPDDIMDGENLFLCGTCIVDRKEEEEYGKEISG